MYKIKRNNKINKLITMVKSKNLMYGCVVANAHGHPYKMDPLTLSVPEQSFNEFLIPSSDNILFWNRQEIKPNETGIIEKQFTDGSWFTYEEKDQTLYIWSKSHKDEILFENIIYLHDLQIKVFAILSVLVEFKTANDEK